MDRRFFAIALVLAVLALVAVAAIGSGTDEKEKETPATPTVPDTPANPDASTIRLDRYVVFAEVTDLVTLTATVPQGQGEVSWSSSDTSIAEVDGGRVQFKKWGPCVIAAESDGARAECLVVVNSYLHRSALEPDNGTAADIEGSRILRVCPVPESTVESALLFYGYHEAAAREGASGAMGYAQYHADLAAEKAWARGGYDKDALAGVMVGEGWPEDLAKEAVSVLKT